MCYSRARLGVDCPVAPLVDVAVAAAVGITVLLPPRQVRDAAVVGEAEPDEGQVQPGEGRVVPRGLRVARPQVVVVHVKVGRVRRGAHLMGFRILGLTICIYCVNYFDGGEILKKVAWRKKVALTSGM